MSEKPGAFIPWSGINQLLAPDERFEVIHSNWKGFLLAPKHSSQLAALFYFLHQHKIEFCIQGRGNEMFPSHPTLIVSARAFSGLVLHEQDVVEVGAGCSLSHLHQFLFERKQEISLEENPLDSPKRSVGSLILSGKTAGMSYQQEKIPETLLGVEIVTREGSQVTWGGGHRSAVAGPALHKLVWAMQSLPGMITKIYLKTYPIPQKRMRLTWAFRQQEALKEHFQALKEFSSTWENLDYVHSGQKTDQSFIFAQISGLHEEMENFIRLCPGYLRLQAQDQRLCLREFLKKQPLKTYQVSCDQRVLPGEYLWYQEIDNRGWWLTSQCLEEKEEDRPLWKQRVWRSLYALR